MLTLEQPLIAKGTVLKSKESSYQFRKGYPYKIYNITNEYVSVKDRDGIEVLFDTIHDLLKVFDIVDRGGSHA